MDYQDEQVGSEPIEENEAPIPTAIIEPPPVPPEQPIQVAQFTPPPVPPQQIQQPQEIKPATPGKGKAIAAMVLGICSILFYKAFFLSIPAAIVGLVFAAKGMKKGSPGRGMAIAGLVTSIVGILAALGDIRDSSRYNYWLWNWFDW